LVSAPPALPAGISPFGTAYAVWGGIGAVGTVAVGLVAFGESASPVRLLCMARIVAGIVGLQLTGGT